MTLPHFIDRILIWLWKLSDWQTRQHCATLPGSTASCGECTQSRTFKIMLTYLLTWQTDSCTPREWLSRCYILHAKSILSHTFSYKSSWALYVHEDDILSSIIGYSLTLYWHNTGSFLRRVWSLTRTASCFSTISACKLFLKSITGGQENSLHDYHCNITCANEYDTPVLKYSFVVLDPTVMRHFDKHMKHSYILLTLWMRQVTVN